MKLVQILATMRDKIPSRFNDYDKVHGSHANVKSGPSQRTERINIRTENLKRSQ